MAHYDVAEKAALAPGRHTPQFDFNYNSPLAEDRAMPTWCARTRPEC